MTQLVRFDPFNEFATLRRAMDRLFEDFAPARLRGASETVELGFPMDVSENDNEVTVKAVLPGVKPEDVDITVTEGVLTIRGESRQEEKEEKENYYRREIRYGAFARSVPLPTRVKHEEAEAEFADGILTVRLPKAEETRPKSIKVKAGGQREAIAAASKN